MTPNNMFLARDYESHRTSFRKNNKNFIQRSKTSRRKTHQEPKGERKADHHLENLRNPGLFDRRRVVGHQVDRRHLPESDIRAPRDQEEATMTEEGRADMWGFNRSEEDFKFGEKRE